MWLSDCLPVSLWRNAFCFRRSKAHYNSDSVWWSPFTGILSPIPPVLPPIDRHCHILCGGGSVIITTWGWFQRIHHIALGTNTLSATQNHSQRRSERASVSGCLVWLSSLHAGGDLVLAKYFPPPPLESSVHCFAFAAPPNEWTTGDKGGTWWSSAIPY